MSSRIPSACLCLCLASTTAAAEPLPPGIGVSKGSRYRLDWSVPEELACSSRHVFIQGIEQARRTPIFLASASETVRLELQKQGTWLLNLKIFDARGKLTAQRSLRSRAEDCSGVLSGAALILELMLQDLVSREPPAAQGKEARAASEDSKRVAKPSAPLAVARMQRSPTTDQPPPKHWDVTATAHAYAGALPAFALGWAVGLGYQMSANSELRLEGGSSTQATTNETVEQVPVQFKVRLSQANLALLGHLYASAQQRHSLGAVAHYGFISTELEGARAVGSRLSWAAVGVQGRSALFLGQGFSAVASGEFLAPLLANEFTEVGGAVLGRLPPVGGLICLGIGSSW